jgi:cytochrome P450
MRTRLIAAMNVTEIQDPIPFDPFSMAFAEDPYPVYARLRDEAPIYHHEELKFWALSRYEDVLKAHADPKRFISGGGVTIGAEEASHPLMIVKDGKDHTIAKGMMVNMFSRSRMLELDSFIRKRAVELIEAAAEKAAGGEVNFVDEFSVRLPLDVIGELIGIPPELRPDVHHLSNELALRGDGIDADHIARVNMQLVQLYIGLITKRRKNPGDDPISRLILTEFTDQDGVKHHMEDFEIAFRFLELGFAGHETVAKAIPNGAMAFANFPDERRKLQGNMELLPKAVAEIMRYDPPSHLQGRTCAVDVEYYGVTVPAGSRFMLLTAAATRDPRAFPDADKFIIERDNDRHTISFGHGVHKCLGFHLAQREITIAFEELFKRFPDWQVDPGRSERSVLTNVRGVSHLPIQFGKHA